MKRTILSLMVSVLTCTGVFAQNEHLHVYRNDGRHFHTYKVSEIEKMEIDLSDRMTITDAEGKETRFMLSVIDSVVPRSVGVPEFHITLKDHPYWNDLLKDETHKKNTVYAAVLSMKGNGVFDDIEPREVEFRGRGNTTWKMEKTPYRFKMSKKVSVCGLPKAKSFALIANYIDCTLMRNAIAFKIAQMLDMPFTNHSIPVHVYLNGNFKGAYMLTEKVGIGSGSVDIDENKGMMFELDTNYDEDFKFTYTWSSKRIPVMIKDPDLKEIAEEIGTDPDTYFSLWKADFKKMADAVVSTPKEGSLRNVIDLESVVDYIFVQCLTGNHEMKHPKSLYMYKKSIDDVYHFGPVWDFDWAYTFDNGEKFEPERPLMERDGDQSGASFIKLLMANNEFRELFKRRLDDFSAHCYADLRTYMDEYARQIEPSAKANGVLWPKDRSSYLANRVESSFDFQKNYITLCNWLDRRLAYMKKQVNYGLY